MSTELAEASEPVPPATVGSSAMPHKRNPQLSDDCITIGAQLRTLVPLALEGMLGRGHARPWPGHRQADRARGRRRRGPRRGVTFADALKRDPRVTAHLDATAIDGLLDPARHTSLSAGIARAAAERARATARDLTGNSHSAP